jgi:hypothetical protein
MWCSKDDLAFTEEHRFLKMVASPDRTRSGRQLELESACPRVSTPSTRWTREWDFTPWTQGGIGAIRGRWVDMKVGKP